MSTQERSKIIRKIGDILEARQEEIAQLESLDTGKHLNFHATLMHHVQQQTSISLLII